MACLVAGASTHVVNHQASGLTVPSSTNVIPLPGIAQSRQAFYSFDCPVITRNVDRDTVTNLLLLTEHIRARQNHQTDHGVCTEDSSC